MTGAFAGDGLKCEAAGAGMDYQLFCIRVWGGAFGRISKGGGTAKILRVFESCISVSNFSHSGADVEYLFQNISSVLPSVKGENELTLNVPDESGRGYETLCISCESRSELITTLLNKLDDLNGLGTDFVLKKHSHRYGGLVETVLRVRSASIVKMQSNGLRHERRRVNPAKKINFNDIVKVQRLTDDDHIVLLHLNSRVLRLSIADVAPFLLALSRNVKFYLNRELQIERINTTIMVEDASGLLKRVKELPVLFEFEVEKHSEARAQERKRIIYVSGEHLIEMAEDEVVATHSLSDIIGLIVDDKNLKKVTVEFKTSRPTQYFIDDRDDFIGSVADAAGTAKNLNFNVRPVPFFPHMLPEQRPVHQLEQETYYLNRFLSEYNGNRDPVLLHLTLKEYASNVQIGKSQCNDYRVVCTVADLLKNWTSSQDFARSTTCCIAISRLLGARYCFDSLKCIADLPAILLQCMRSGNAVLVYAASVALKSAFRFTGSIQQADLSTLKQEQANRLIVLSFENMQQFAALLHTYSLMKNQVLQAYGMVKLLTAGLESLSMDSDASWTWIKAFESSLLTLGDVLCALSRSERDILRESTAALFEAVLAKTSPLVSTHFRSLSSKRCLVIVHFKNALFSRTDLTQSRSARLVFSMMDGNEESTRLLKSLLPKGAFDIYHHMANKMIQTGKDHAGSFFCAWIKLLEVLRRDTIETPLFIWNNLKRTELRKFLEQEIQGFSAAASSNVMVSYDCEDVKLVYSAISDGNGTVVANVHLELLVDHCPPVDEKYAALWKVPDPLALFQAVFQALLLGFTPFFGHNNVPEVDLRLSVHVLTWIYERYAGAVSFSLQTSNVIEASVGMLQEVLETEHQVFIFKLAVFLLTMMEIGGRDNVLRFVRSGGTTVVISMMVLSLAECCSDNTEFESDGWGLNTTNPLETVDVVDLNGKVRIARVPSGKVREALDKASLNGSLDAKDAIKWQAAEVPSKIQFGMTLDMLEALLRISGSENNVESYPPSAACLSLSREEVLCHLVQSLLRAKSTAFGRILNIISVVVRVSNHALSLMHKLGTFEILLWKLFAGDIGNAERKLILGFLCQTHKFQVIDDDSNSSILSLYLPKGLVLKLTSEDADTFLTLVASEKNDPEVVWNMQMLEKLSDHLSQQLEPYVRARASDPMALYIHTPRPLIYEELADSVYSPPFYLHNLLDTESFPNYPINDPVGFLNNLIKDLSVLECGFKQSTLNGMASSYWKKEASKIRILLRSLAYLLERFPKLSLPLELELVAISLAAPAVCNTTVTDSSLLDIILQTTKILKRSCASTSSDSETSNGFINFALSVLSLGTQLNADGSFPKPVSGQLELCIAGAFLLLRVSCESRVGRKLLGDDIRWRKGLWCALCAAAGDAASDFPTGPSPISFAALDCLRSLVKEEQSAIFKQGLHLPLLLLTFSLATPRIINGCKPALLYSAADFLRCLLDKEPTALENLIPAPLLTCLADLDGPEYFLTMLVSDLTQPKALWDTRVREELRQRVYERMCHHGIALAENETSDEDDERNWLRNFSYDCHADELVIDGFYIKGLISCNADGLDFVLESSLIDSLIAFVVEHSEAAVMVENERGNKNRKITLSEYLSAFTALEECMIYALRMDMEALLMQSRLSTLSSIVLRDKVDVLVQIRIASIAKLLITSGMLQTVLQCDLLKALSLQLWEAIAEFSKEGMEDVLRATLDALHAFSEHLPAAVSGTSYFSAHGTLLPLMALFCVVSIPLLRGGFASSPSSKVASEHRITSAKILGQLLLAAKGVTRRSKLLKDLQEQKSNAARIAEVTDMHELLSIAEQDPAEDSKLVRSLLLLLPLEILSALARHPTEACKVYDGSSSTVTLVWDEARRHQVKSVIIKEAARIRTLVNGKSVCELPAWSFNANRPVFLRWALVIYITAEGDKRTTYRQDSAEDYAQELYLGGFYVDQFLKDYKNSTIEPVLLERFLHELRTALVLGKSPDGLQTQAFDFHDRRRLLLGLLILLKLHPQLLSRRSNVDIFLPLYDLLSIDSGMERRALAQPAMLLLHSAATHPDIADCIISEELVYTLASFLCLEVPSRYWGDSGTDPRLCSLILLLRLLRLSSNTVGIVLRLGIMRKVEDLVLEFEGSAAVQNKAAECLAVMCADKRKGREVAAILEKLVPCNVKGYGSWKVSLSRIQDEIVDMKTLQHFLRNVNPAPWWTSDSPEGRDCLEEPVAVVEASFSFSKARMSDFDNEAETVFRRCIDSAAWVDSRDVRILRKRLNGGVTIEFEVRYVKERQQEQMMKRTVQPEVMNATLFKEKLEKATAEVFATTFLESMGAARVISVSLREVEVVCRQSSWSIPSLGDKNIIYVGKTAVSAAENGEELTSVLQEKPVLLLQSSLPPSSLTAPPPPPSLLTTTARTVPPSSSSVSSNPSRPPPPPPPPLPSSQVLLRQLQQQAPAFRAVHANGSSNSTHYAANGSSNGTNGSAHQTSRKEENGSNERKNGFVNGNGTLNGHAKDVKRGTTDGPVLQAPEPPSRDVFNSAVVVKSEDGRRAANLEAALDIALQVAEIIKENQQAARTNFLEAFEDEMAELERMIKNYSKLIHKYPLQPQLCYSLMVAWEENCLDLMSDDERAKYGRSIAAFDICRFDDPEFAAAEAKRKFQGILKIRREKEWKEKSKQLKGDMSAELAKAVGERKEKVIVEAAEGELQALSRGKIQKRSTAVEL